MIRAVLRRLSPIAVLIAVALVASSASALGVGDRATDINLRDTNGRQVRLSGMRGNVVLVNFMASWCEPCGDETPVLERLYRAYRSRGFRIVAVSQDRNQQNLSQFLRQHPVSFPVVLDQGQQVSGSYRPPTMPSSYIVDRNGIVRHVHRGFRAGDGARLEAQIRGLL
jgi:peroxiredoxin